MGSSVRLRPGLGWARRDDTRLQVGVDEPHRVLLPEHPDVRALLSALAGGPGEPPTSHAATTALDRLESAGLLVDDDAGLPPVLLAQHGRDAPRRVERRSESAVRLLGAVGPGEPLRAMLRAAGVTEAARGAPAHVAPLTVVVSSGPVDRRTADALVRADLDHLLVELGPRRCRVGPLVSPGHTACLRCVDAHESEHEPGRRLVLAQLSDRPASTPVDPTLASMALGWAARDVVRFIDGDRPAARSATTTFDLDLDAPRTRAWLRHPHCGCAWDVL